MNKSIRSVKGIKEYLPEETYFLSKIEYKLIEVLQSYGYQEIRIPIIEKTKLFKKIFGTDLNNLKKEMYNFKDKKFNFISLRPEGTIGCIRSMMQHNKFYNQKFHKLWYKGPMFRYAKQQLGKYREFNQIGIEIYGYKNTSVDIELIMMNYRFWKLLKISDKVYLEVNSIGLKENFNNFKKHLMKFFLDNIDNINPIFHKKIKNNPIKLLDNKNKDLQNLLKKAPNIQNYLSDNERNKFKKFCNFLNCTKIKYKINPFLVRGLDYYDSIVFEWITNSFGRKISICGGGRYNNVIRLTNNIKIPAIGCAIGLDRLFLLKKKIKKQLLIKKVDIYLIPVNYNLQIHLILIGEKIRNTFPKLSIFLDFSKNSLTKQLKNAYEKYAKIALILGEKEFKNKKIIVRYLNLKDQIIILQNKLINFLKKIYL